MFGTTNGQNYTSSAEAQLINYPCLETDTFQRHQYSFPQFSTDVDRYQYNNDSMSTWLCTHGAQYELASAHQNQNNFPRSHLNAINNQTTQMQMLNIEQNQNIPVLHLLNKKQLECEFVSTEQS